MRSCDLHPLLLSTETPSRAGFCECCLSLKLSLPESCVTIPWQKMSDSQPLLHGQCL